MNQNSRSCMTLKSSVVIFQTLEPLQLQWPLCTALDHIPMFSVQHTLTILRWSVQIEVHTYVRDLIFHWSFSFQSIYWSPSYIFCLLVRPSRFEVLPPPMHICHLFKLHTYILVKHLCRIFVVIKLIQIQNSNQKSNQLLSKLFSSSNYWAVG